MDHIGIGVHKHQSPVCVLEGRGDRIKQRIATDRFRFAEVFGEQAGARIPRPLTGFGAA
jgi:hypothetical protein